MSAPLRLCSFSRWRKMRETFLQVAESSDWTKRTKVKNKQSPNGRTLPPEANDESLFGTFRNTLKMRSDQANRSVLVPCMEKDATYVLSALQKKFGNIVEANYYAQLHGQSSLLVEFDMAPRPHSFIVGKGKLPTVLNDDESLLQKMKICHSEPFNMQSLINCNDISDQITCLYNGVKMSEPTIRQHYFVGEIIRNVVHRVHSSANVYFYGSSVCGLALEGKSDLDLVILQSGYTDKDVLGSLYHEMRQRIYTKLFSDLFFIGGARVPILKFNQNHTEMSCDVSANSLSGIMMAEMLCWLNEYEPMFHPLVMAVKIWAREHNISGSGMGSHFSNHMLTMLVISFLQEKRFLPALHTVYVDKYILSKLNSSDFESTWNNLRLKRINKLRVAEYFQHDEKDLGFLLHGFFEFYSKFSFNTCLLDVGYGKIVNTQHMDDIYMPNPFEKQHNMCRNIRFNTVEKFRDRCIQSAATLEVYSKKSDHNPWGLMCIMNNKSKKQRKHSVLDLNVVFSSNDIELVEDVKGASEQSKKKPDGKDKEEMKDKIGTSSNLTDKSNVEIKTKLIDNALLKRDIPKVNLSVNKNSKKKKKRKKTDKGQN